MCSFASNMHKFVLVFLEGPIFFTKLCIKINQPKTPSALGAVHL